MVIDRLRLFTGLPLYFTEDILVYSPTIREIAEIGEYNYSVNVMLATFDKDRILKVLPVEDDESKSEYSFLINIPDMPIAISKAISFFVKRDVSFDHSQGYFLVDGLFFVGENNFSQFAELVKHVNCMMDEPKKEPKFRNSMAQKMFEQVKKFEALSAKRNKNTLELKDILSILCYGSDNGINIFNAPNLTIYQAYEQWERLGIKEIHLRLHPVWANGHLEDPSKFQEWMIKTKL